MDLEESQHQAKGVFAPLKIASSLGGERVCST